LRDYNIREAGASSLQTKQNRFAKTKSEETIMRNTVLTILGSALIMASTVQFAAASERHHHRTTAPAATQQFRDVNASMAPTADYERYAGYSGGISAPAGR
jgi:hypothetical protein